MIGVFPTKHEESLPLNGFSSFFIYNCRTSAAFLIGAIIPVRETHRHSLSALAPDPGSLLYSHQ